MAMLKSLSLFVAALVVSLAMILVCGVIVKSKMYLRGSTHLSKL